MLYTLLVGKAPFECGTIKGTLTKVVMEPYTFPPYLSSNAKDLIDRMLQKRAEDRIKLEDISKHPFISSPKTSKIVRRLYKLQNQLNSTFQNNSDF